MDERAIVPTPKAASEGAPKRAIKAVSTRPVNGSAIKENKTGIDNFSKVEWGDDSKEWAETEGGGRFM